MSSAAPMQQAKSEAFAKTTDRSIQLAPQSDLMGATEHADLRTQASSQRQLQRAANHSQQSPPIQGPAASRTNKRTRHAIEKHQLYDEDILCSTSRR